MKSPNKAIRKAAELRKKTEAKRGVKVTVEVGNVLQAAGDVLALKYAQARHGADRGAAELFRNAGRTLPKPKEWTAAKLVDSPESVKARQTLIVGTPHLWEYEPEFRYQFRYKDVRKLNEMFLSSLVGHPVKSVVTTLHGEGVDLDLFGILDSTIAGFQSAANHRQFPDALERVFIVTKRHEKKDILQQRLDEILPGGIIEVGASPIRIPAKRFPDVFVAMRLDDEMESVFLNGIRAGVHRVRTTHGKLTCSHMEPEAGNLLDAILHRIRRAKYIVADLTPASGESAPRANVCFEVGYAYKAKGAKRVRQIVLVARKGTDIPKVMSNLAGQGIQYYSSVKDLADKVRRVLANLEKGE